MILGEVMGASGNHSQMPTHAHINLAGGVFGCLFGLAYRNWPALKSGILPVVHFALYIIGVPVMASGLAILYSSGEETPPAVAMAVGGSMAFLLGTLVFLFLFATRAFKTA
jgi:hypothetical protein